MEDFTVDFVLDKGPYAEAVRIPVKPFTLVGATTRKGLLSSPLRERFGLNFELDFYAVADLTLIVRRSAGLLGVLTWTVDAAEEIARRSRGTPRIANRLLRRVRDFAQVAPGRRRRHRPGQRGAHARRRRRAGPGRSGPALPEDAHRPLPGQTGRPVSAGGGDAAGDRTRSKTWSSRTCCTKAFILRTPVGRQATPRALCALAAQAAGPKHRPSNRCLSTDDRGLRSLATSQRRS